MSHSAKLARQHSKGKQEFETAAHSGRSAPQDQGGYDLTEHKMSVEEVIAKFNTNLETGLTEAEVLRLREKFGLNMLTPPPLVPWYWQLFKHMTGLFSLLLWGAGIMCMIAYAVDTSSNDFLALGLVLFFVTIVTGLFSYYQDAGAQKAMAAFATMVPKTTQVIREGKERPIDSSELVPGDIVEIKGGDKIPADVRLATATNFRVNNAPLTGESLPQNRKADISAPDRAEEATNICFFGTLADAGRATGIVVRTGDNAYIGTINKLTSETDGEETTLAKEIHHFINIVSAVAFFLGFSFLIICIAMQTFSAVETLVFIIGIIVANVPEGLLATVTVSLTLTSKTMAKKQVLVKNLEAVETLGSTSVIASDKTGTLTQNVMTVKAIVLDNKLVPVRAREDPLPKHKDTASFKILFDIAVLCNNSTFKEGMNESYQKDNMSLPIQKREKGKGDATEVGILKLTERVLDQKTPNGYLLSQEYRKARPMKYEIPFDSANKYQLSIHDMGSDGPLLVLKGAPERVIDRCDYFLIDGKEVPKTAELVEELTEHQSTMMFNGERVLGFAYKKLDAKKFHNKYVYDHTLPVTEANPSGANFPLVKGDGIVFAGLISLMDPPREAVPYAVDACQSAGIRVIMVTGDHPETAESIARDIGIIEGRTKRVLHKQRLKLNQHIKLSDIDDFDKDIQAQVVTGAQLIEITARPDGVDYLDRILDYHQIVFARTSPAQKLQIVKALQAKTICRRNYNGELLKDPQKVDYVVAVTGDGVNDAPALSKADIGIAMRIAGTQVAHEAADMLLMDDNFASIVQGVEEGRLIFDNLKKSIAYTLSSNIPEITPFLLFILLALPLPLPTVLILCIDLGTDMWPAISLAYEQKESDIMERPPRNPGVDRLVTGKLVNFSYLQVGIFQAVAGFYCYFVVLRDYGFPAHILPGLAVDWPIRAVQAAVNNGNVVFRLLADTTQSCEYSPTNSECAPFFEQVSKGGTLHPLVPCNIGVYNPDAAPDDFSQPCWNTYVALGHAQCAYFVSIIIVQWADLVACKTRKLSLFTQGMRNMTMNSGLLFETLLGVALCYIPGLNMPLGTRPIKFVHWLGGLPFSVMILLYDEVRKYFLRTLPDVKDKYGKTIPNWVARHTYY